MTSASPRIFPPPRAAAASPLPPDEDDREGDLAAVDGAVSESPENARSSTSPPPSSANPLSFLGLRRVGKEGDEDQKREDRRLREAAGLELNRRGLPARKRKRNSLIFGAGDDVEVRWPTRSPKKVRPPNDSLEKISGSRRAASAPSSPAKRVLPSASASPKKGNGTTSSKRASKRVAQRKGRDIRQPSASKPASLYEEPDEDDELEDDDDDDLITSSDDLDFDDDDEPEFNASGRPRRRTAGKRLPLSPSSAALWVAASPKRRPSRASDVKRAADALLRDRLGVSVK